MPCDTRCERAFVACMRNTLSVKSNQTLQHRSEAYDFCRHELERGSEGMRHVCRPGCADTSVMRTVSARWHAKTCAEANALVKHTASSIRLAVITFLSEDSLNMCYAFMSFYLGVHSVPAKDVYTMLADSKGVDALAHFAPCLNAAGIARANMRFIRYEVSGVFDEPTKQHALSRLQNDLLGHFRTPTPRRRPHADGQAGRRLESHLGGGSHHANAHHANAHHAHTHHYTHTLVVDLDELLLPNPRKYVSLQIYLSQNAWRAIVVTRCYEIQHHRPHFASASGRRLGVGGVLSLITTIKEALVGPQAPPEPAWGGSAVAAFNLSAFDWSETPLLAQRVLWVPACPYSKPVLARVPTNFRFATHEISEMRTLQPCRRKALDCVDDDLLLIHITCIDGSRNQADVKSKRSERCRLAADALDGRPNFFETWRQERPAEELPEWVRRAFLPGTPPLPRPST